jgi:hypothetical protein
MAERAQGQTWVVEGEKPAAVRKALAAAGAGWAVEALKVPRLKGARVRVWPGEGSAGGAAEALSRGLGAGARLALLRLGAEELEVEVWAAGARVLHEQMPRVLRTSAVLGRTHASLQRVAGALASPAPAPPLLRDEDCAPSFLALVGLTPEALAAGPAEG